MSRPYARVLHELLFDNPGGLDCRQIAKRLEITVEEARAMVIREEEEGVLGTTLALSGDKVYTSRLMARPPSGVVSCPASLDARRDVLHRILNDHHTGLTRADIALQMGCQRSILTTLLDDELSGGRMATELVGGRRIYRTLVSKGQLTNKAMMAIGVAVVLLLGVAIFFASR